MLDKGCDLYYGSWMDLIALLHPDDPEKQARIRAYVERLRSCQPDPDCPRCDGTGLAHGVEKVRRSIRGFLGRHQREIPFVESCPVCLAPQWNSLTLDP